MVIAALSPPLVWSLPLYHLFEYGCLLSITSTSAFVSAQSSPPVRLLHLYRLHQATIQAIDVLILLQGRRKVARSMSVQRRVGEGGAVLPTPDSGQVVTHS